MTYREGKRVLFLRITSSRFRFYSPNGSESCQCRTWTLQYLSNCRCFTAQGYWVFSTVDIFFVYSLSYFQFSALQLLYTIIIRFVCFVFFKRRFQCACVRRWKAYGFLVRLWDSDRSQKTQTKIGCRQGSEKNTATPVPEVPDEILFLLETGQREDGALSKRSLAK